MLTEILKLLGMVWALVLLTIGIGWLLYIARTSLFWQDDVTRRTERDLRAYLRDKGHL